MYVYRVKHRKILYILCIGYFLVFSPFIIISQTHTDSTYKETSYTIYPLLKTGDILPNTDGEEVEETLPALSGYNSFNDRLFIQGKVGMFAVTKDTIIPLVTILDTIPGTKECFDDLISCGFTLSWPEAISQSMSNRKFDYRSAATGMEVTGSEEVVFVYFHDDRFNVYTASPGAIKKVFTLPEKAVFNGFEYDLSEQDGLRQWFLTERQDKPVIGISWIDNYELSIGDKTALFSFDGEKIKKFAADGDSIEGIESLLQYVGSRHLSKMVWWDNLVESCFFIGMPTGTSESRLFLYNDGKIFPITMVGQKLLNNENADFHSGYAPVSVSFDPPIAYLNALCSIDNNLFHTLLAASKEGMTNLSSWAIGDSLPKTGGGIISGFNVDGISTADSSIIADILIEDSDLGIREGIFSRKGKVTKMLVAQGDAAPASVGGTFSKFLGLANHYSPASEEQDLIFLAEIKNGKAKQGIFLLSKGKITKIVTNQNFFHYKDKSGHNMMAQIKDINGFITTYNNNVFLSASWSGGQGWFLATPK